MSDTNRPAPERPNQLLRTSGPGFRTPPARKGTRYRHVESRGHATRTNKTQRAAQLIADIETVRRDAAAYNAMPEHADAPLDPDPDGTFEVALKNATIRIDSEPFRRRFKRPKV